MPHSERSAELRDQASDHDAVAADSRDFAAEQHDVAADIRDMVSQRRDTAADLRNTASDERDAKAELRDQTDDESEAFALRPESPNYMTRRALDRKHAAADRTAARDDRRADTADRSHAKLERETAAADRGTAASGRIFSQIDRRSALADRRSAAADRRHATEDGLTGVYMRTPGLLRLAQEMDAAQRDGVSLVVAFVDVDGLKRVNVSGGHAAGDRTLVHVAATLRTTVGPDDLIIRYGGDEFLCVLIGTSMDAAIKRLSWLHELLCDSDEPAAVSYGLAEMQADESSDELVSRADNALSVARANDRGLYVLEQLKSPQASRIESQLQDALDTRIKIEQANGRVAEYGGIDIDEALAAIRRYVHTNEILLSHVAGLLASGALSASEVTPLRLAQHAEPSGENGSSPPA